MYATAIMAQLLNKRQATLYTYPGGTIAPLYHECQRLQVPILCGRSEQGAGYMAIAEAQLTGKATFVAVTSGPGATNLATCIADAWYDSTPLIAITGQVGTADLQRSPELRQRGFQEVPVPELMRSICKRVYQPHTPEELAKVVAEAVQLAESGRPGPVVIDLPMSVQLQQPDPMPTLPQLAVATAPVPEPELDEVLQRLHTARRPLLLVGAGAKRHSAAVRQLVQTWQLPAVATVRGLGVLPGDHPLYGGWIGHTGLPWANWALGEADLLLVLGSRLDVRQTGTCTELFTAKTIIHVDLDPVELEQGRFGHTLAVHGDLQEVVPALIAAAPVSVDRWSSWRQELEVARQRLPLQDYGQTDGVRPDRLLQQVDQLTAGRPLLVTSGVGSHQQWVARYLTFDFPMRQLFASAGHGTMGFCLPAAIGLQRQVPDRMVLAVDGDGSFQMNIQELMLLRQLQLPVKILLLDNQRLGIVSQFQQIVFQSDPVTGDFPSPDFCAIAHAYGLAAWKMLQYDEALLCQWLECEGPALLHVRVQHDAPVSPMLLAGQAPGEMWYRYPWEKRHD